jgi:hypothetical protein
MAYSPVFFEADRVPFIASATTTGGQVVAVGTTAYNVAPTAGASDSVVGVASNDAATGTQLMVYTTGVHRLTASGSIAIGARVISAAAGAVATFGSDTDFTHAIGKALTAATDGQPVDVLIAL